MSKDALSVALQFLKFRPRSVFEVKKKLRSKKYEEKEIDKTISVLLNNKLLDDGEFARMWVADRNRFRPSGSFLLRLELKRLGVPSGIIDERLTSQDEFMLAKKAIADK